jgi:hypothetical protein
LERVGELEYGCMGVSSRRIVFRRNEEGLINTMVYHQTDWPSSQQDPIGLRRSAEALDPSLKETYTGRYVFNDPDRTVVDVRLRSDGVLTYGSADKDESELRYVRNHHFVFVGAPVGYLEFLSDPEGRIYGLTPHPYGNRGYVALRQE